MSESSPSVTSSSASASQDPGRILADKLAVEEGSVRLADIQRVFFEGMWDLFFDSLSKEEQTKTDRKSYIFDFPLDQLIFEDSDGRQMSLASAIKKPFTMKMKKEILKGTLVQRGHPGVVFFYKIRNLAELFPLCEQLKDSQGEPMTNVVKFP